MNKNFKVARSNKSSGLTQSIIKSASEMLEQKKQIKQASISTPVPTRIAFDKDSAFIKSATNHGLGVYEADGNVWCVEKDAEGRAWLVRNAELTDENELVDELIKSADINLGDCKSFFS